MIITIDGPAGAGKSTVAQALAERLDFRFLDTGAMYRAIALAGKRRGLDWDLPSELAQVAREVKIRIEGKRIFLGEEDVSAEIRTPAVTAVTRYAAENLEVREQLVAMQRKLAEGIDMVTEGRDQGTFAFPDAECKIFLTANGKERALRRFKELQAKGEPVSLEEIFDAQELRDREDESREVAPLMAAADAIEFKTDGLSLDEVVDQLEALVREKLKR